MTILAMGFRPRPPRAPGWDWRSAENAELQVAPEKIIVSR